MNIPDANLRAAEALGKAPNAPITEGEMATLTILTAEEQGIRDLTGLEFATNLTGLWLYGNSLADVSPLSGLTPGKPGAWPQQPHGRIAAFGLDQPDRIVALRQQPRGRIAAFGLDPAGKPGAYRQQDHGRIAAFGLDPAGKPGAYRQQYLGRIAAFGLDQPDKIDPGQQPRGRIAAFGLDQPDRVVA